jgi:anti-anti-sigma regulatory factor
LIEIIEKLQEVNGKIGYYNLAPIVAKTFTIMGLTKYSSVFETEETAVNEL